MKIIGIIAILVDLFFTIKVVLREKKKNARSTHIIINNQQEMESQLQDWTENYKPTISYSSEDYICRIKMHNGETEEISQIERVDYMSTVQNVIRKNEV